jgi:hypothetical protein
VTFSLYIDGCVAGIILLHISNACKSLQSHTLSTNSETKEKEKEAQQKKKKQMNSISRPV